MFGFRGFYFFIYLLIGMLLAAGCTTSLSPSIPPVKNISTPATPVLPVAPHPAAASLEQTDYLQGTTGLFINISPVPDHLQGDTITFHGTTNLPAGENLSLVIRTTDFHGCQKTIYLCRNPDTVNAICCMGGFNRTVPIVPGMSGMNTWSFAVNTLEYDFRPGSYVVYAVSGKTYGIQIFKILEKQGSSMFWLAVDPVPDTCAGDCITISGTTNLPGGENITTRIFESRYKCTKCQRKNDSVDGCCGDQIPLAVTVMPGKDGINFWSREVNTSAYDFRSGDYEINAGDASRELWNSSGFTIRERPDPSPPWIAVDPVPHHYLGEIITIRGTTNLQPQEFVTVRISGSMPRCAKCRGDFADSVVGCCGGFNRTVAVRPGGCGTNIWSLDIDTAGHDFAPDGDYWIGMNGRCSQVQHSSFFTLHGVPQSNLTLNLPAQDPGGYTLRFSGQANTGNGPGETLLLTFSSDSGKKAGYTVPVYRNGTGYSWNFTLDKSAITPYNFLSVNVSSQTSPAIKIERVFMYTNEPMYYPYNPVSP